MADATHPTAAHNLPFFITAPGETDVLMVIMGVVLALAVLGFGILFFRLHSLPERIAHKSHKLQFEIVAVLGLISLFTHKHIFWVVGLMLALVDFPDLGGWLGRIAGSVEKIAGSHTVERNAEESGEIAASVKAAEAVTDMGHGNIASIKRESGASTKSPVVPAGSRG
jgi:multisubunit Na+/H+ antiporter MnhF subunit